MIKQFGWEKRMSEKIDAKREEELVWIRWARLLGIVGFTAKYVLASVISLLAHHLLFLSYTVPAVTMLSTYAT